MTKISKKELNKQKNWFNNYQNHWPVYNEYKILTFKKMLEFEGRNKIIQQNLNNSSIAEDEKVIYGVSGIKGRYDPTDTPGMIKDFAEANNEEDILKFTNKYGLLGLPDNIESIEEPLNFRLQEGICYPYKWFVSSSNKFRRILSLYEIISQVGGNLEKKKLLRDRIKVKRDNAPFPSYISPVENAAQVSLTSINNNKYIDEGTNSKNVKLILDNKDILYLKSNDLKEKKLSEKAMFFIGNEVNQKLKGNVFPQINGIIHNKNDYYMPWAVETNWNVSSLYTAIYFHLYYYIKRKKPVRRCKHCGDIIPPEKRADAEYCSNNCRVKAHRANKSN